MGKSLELLESQGSSEPPIQELFSRSKPCEKCGADAGELCVSGSGNPLSISHAVRRDKSVDEYLAALSKFNEASAKITAKYAEEALAEDEFDSGPDLDPAEAFKQRVQFVMGGINIAAGIVGQDKIIQKIAELLVRHDLDLYLLNDPNITG